MYKHKKLGSHYALTKLNLKEPVYLHHFFNYRQIIYESKQLVLLREQLLDAAQQVLLQRKIQRELDIDMGLDRKLITNENNDQPGRNEPDTTLVIVFELMRPWARTTLWGDLTSEVPCITWNTSHFHL